MPPEAQQRCSLTSTVSFGGLDASEHPYLFLIPSNPAKSIYWRCRYTKMNKDMFCAVDEFRIYWDKQAKDTKAMGWATTGVWRKHNKTQIKNLLKLGAKGYQEELQKNRHLNWTLKYKYGSSNVWTFREEHCKLSKQEQKHGVKSSMAKTGYEGQSCPWPTKTLF